MVITTLILTLFAAILGMTPDEARFENMDNGTYDAIYHMAVEEGWHVFEDGTIANAGN